MVLYTQQATLWSRMCHREKKYEYMHLSCIAVKFILQGRSTEVNCTVVYRRVDLNNFIENCGDLGTLIFKGIFPTQLKADEIYLKRNMIARQKRVDSRTRDVHVCGGENYAQYITGFQRHIGICFFIKSHPLDLFGCYRRPIILSSSASRYFFLHYCDKDCICSALLGPSAQLLGLLVRLRQERVSFHLTLFSPTRGISLFSY